MLTDIAPYQLPGAGIAPLLGRTEDKRKILRHLCKTSPDHVSLVGPRCIGKTVFLRALPDVVVAGKSSIASCVYWDLRRNTPKSDDEFYQGLAHQLLPSIRTINPALCTFIDEQEGVDFYNIKSLFEVLSNEKKIVLTVFDGLDPVLRNSEVTKNLWDSLRSLGDMSSFRMVTGTREALRELCSSDDSKTSDFFNIFSMGNFRLLPFTEQDSNDFLEPFKMHDIKISDGAMQVIREWCGGIPVLSAALCLDAWSNIKKGSQLSPELIKELAEKAYANETMHDFLHYFFRRDCNELERALLTEIVRKPAVKRDLSVPGIKTLIHKGFLSETKDGFVCPSLFLKRFVEENGESVTHLRSLFGTEKAYAENIPALLELQLSQIQGIDATLRSHIETMSSFVGEPSEAAKFVRIISDRAYTIVLQKEVPTGELPQEWLNQWARGDFPYNPPRKLPLTDERKERYLLVQKIAHTGYRLNNRRLTPNLQLLMSHMKLLGDYGFHQGTREPTPSFMYAVCVTAIELAKQISETYG